MESELVCNFRKCRKSLKSHAWVTSCSHIFCDEDGYRELQKMSACPACETSLTARYDIIRVDLQPAEQYKSMVLAGQKPETIIDICSRAFSFWTYQIHQERMYQEYVITKAKERNTQLEQYYQQLITRSQTELETIKAQLSAKKKDLENTRKEYQECQENMKKQFHEHQEKMLEKNRQFQKLQSMYDTLRRKMINPSRFDSADDPQRTPSLNLNKESFDMPFFATGEDFLKSGNPGGGPAGDGDNTRPYPGSFTRNAASEMSNPRMHQGREFVLRPNHTPIRGSVSDNVLAHGSPSVNRYPHHHPTPRGGKYGNRK